MKSKMLLILNLTTNLCTSKSEKAPSDKPWHTLDWKTNPSFELLKCENIAL